MNSIKLRALGKINLGLDVVRKRDDGYHEVRMIMQTVNIYDCIDIKKKSSQEIKIKTNLYYLPTNENNLVYKAARLLLDEFQIKEGLQINLKKVIPVAAGMAGGSSDAAAVLFGVNKMFSLGLSMEDLMKRGVKIGADVPYCLMRGTALAEGIGDKLTPLPSVPKAFVLIAKPNISVSTKFVYENLRANELQKHPDIDGIIDSIKMKDLHGIAGKLENVLETVTIKEYPVIEELKNVMKQHGALNSLMSGSGPTVFGLFENDRVAKKAYSKVKESGLAKQIYLTDFYNRG